MKLVIFDLDQTLVDLFAVHDRAYYRTMKSNEACFSGGKKVIGI